MFACLALPASAASGVEPDALEAVARAFSPRVEVHHGRQAAGPKAALPRAVGAGQSCSATQLVTLDIDGLQRLLGTPDEIGRELAREAAGRGCAARVAIAATRTAAMLLALGRPGLTIVPRGEERVRVSDLPLGVLGVLQGVRLGAVAGAGQASNRGAGVPLLDLFRRWGLRTLGDLARLPAAALSARIGQEGLQWQQVARGDDLEPLVAAPPEAPIEEVIDLDWPVEGLEPLSFLLPRLLDPICSRLERLDQAAVALHLSFRLATREQETRCLQLPAPMRDARVLRTLVLLHLESHPLPAGVDRLAILVEPAPARIVQFSLLTRALPFPEQVATLVARLGALMGERRVGRAALVDSHRPGVFAMQPFTVTEGGGRLAAPKLAQGERRQEGGGRWAEGGERAASRVTSLAPSVALRRFRLPVPARVLVEDGRPVRITTERRGLEGGRVEASAGPWRTSGEWWRVGEGPRPQAKKDGDALPAASCRLPAPWDRDEWDVALADGAVYRVSRDRASDRWFVEGILD